MKLEYTISLHEMPCLCIIGILPEERRTQQPVFVSVVMTGDFSKVATEGHLEDGVDYSQVQSDLGTLLRHLRFRLVETAVYGLCQWILWRYPPVDSVQISVKKPLALKGQGIPQASLKIRRTKALGKGKGRPKKIKDLIFKCADGALRGHGTDQEGIMMTDGTQVFLERAFFENL